MTSVLSNAYTLPPPPPFRQKMDYSAESYVPGFGTFPGQQPGGNGDGNGSDGNDDRRRNKLNYLRAPVACQHCRRRKIRCKPKDKEEHGRCASCFRLDKECIYLPVNEEIAAAAANSRRNSRGYVAQPFHTGFDGRSRNEIRRSPPLRRVGSVPLTFRPTPMPPPVPSSGTVFSDHPFPDSGVSSSEASPRNASEHMGSFLGWGSEQSSANGSGEFSASTGYLPDQSLSPASQPAVPGLPDPNWGHSNGEYGPPPSGYPYPGQERSMSFSAEPTGVYPVGADERVPEPTGHYHQSMMSPILSDGGISAAPLNAAMHVPASVASPYPNWVPPLTAHPPPHPPLYGRNSVDSAWYIDNRSGHMMGGDNILPVTTEPPANGSYHHHYGSRQ